ncbi:hypothetical protein N7497_011094, partial [Penicillium chrysogenum]
KLEITAIDPCNQHDIIPSGTIAQLGERAIEVRKVAGSIPARPINGTIAQLGERAIEVRKVAGSIPARPIIFCTIPKYHWDIVKWGDMGWDFRLKLTALTHSLFERSLCGLPLLRTGVFSVSSASSN